MRIELHDCRLFDDDDDGVLFEWLELVVVII